MRVIAFSDTHGVYRNAETIVKRNLGADLFIFLGDGERDFDRLVTRFPEKRLVGVGGNCDFCSMLPDSATESFEGATIFFTHGHKYGVRGGTATLCKFAETAGADIVLFGHTHQRYLKYENGVYVVNPGSAGCPRDSLPPSFAIIDITPKGIMVNHVDV